MVKFLLRTKNPELTNNNDEEISLMDILLFIMGAWKTILSLGIFGLLVSSLYLLITPDQYEAIANINMGRISPGGSNIEEPQSVINRISKPTIFDPAVISACGLEDAKSHSIELARAIKLSIPRGTTNIIELRVARVTPELASSCATSVFQLIAKTQLDLITQMSKAARVSNSAKLIKVDQRLAQNKELLAKAERPRGVLPPAYFPILSETRALEDERDRLLAMPEDGVTQPICSRPFMWRVSLRASRKY